jgi:hypothetical protein
VKFSKFEGVVGAGWGWVGCGLWGVGQGGVGGVVVVVYYYLYV